jgi:hypothetical protein
MTTQPGGVSLTETERLLGEIATKLDQQNDAFIDFLNSGAPGGGGHGFGGAGGVGGSGGGGGRPNPIAGMTTSRGGGLGGAIENKARKAQGVGWVMAGYDEVVSQRNKNMQYQNVEGGTNASGFAERVREEANVWATKGMFTSQEARANFKGITALGYTEQRVAGGQNRNDAMGFMYKGKSAYGQTTEEGLQALQVASQSAQVDFKALAESLDEVAKTAGKAGVNAAMARTQFVAAMDQAIKMGYGGGSTAAANIVTQTQASYGRAYAQNSDYSGVFSQSRTYMVASKNGMSAAGAVQMQRQDPAGYMAMDAKLTYEQTLQVIGPEMAANIVDLVNQAGGPSALLGADGIAANIFVEACANSGQDPWAMKNSISALSGVRWATDDAGYAAITNTVAGRGTGAAAEDEKKKSSRYGADGKILPGQAGAGEMSPNAEGEKTGSGVKAPGGRPGPGGGAHSYDKPDAKGIDKNDAAYKGYRSGAKGTHSPAIEALLRNISARGKKPEEVNVLIGGKVFNLAQALEEFPEAVAAGDVQILDQGMMGMSTGDVAGTREQVDQATVRSQSAAAARDSRGKDKGTWDAETAGDKTKGTSGEGGGQVTIAPEAKWLIAMRPQYDPNYTLSPGSGG